MIEIFGLPIAVHVRKVLVTAIHKGIPHDNIPVFPFDPPAGWRNLSPTGLVPVMREGSFTLPDSTAITLYLDASQPGPRVIPEDPRAMARAMFYDAYAGQTLFRNAIHGLFYQLRIAPGVFDQPTDQTVVDAILSGPLPGFLAYLEQSLEDRFFGGATPGIGDIAIASNLVNYSYLGFWLNPIEHPRLIAFLDAMVDWAPFAEALQREAPVARAMSLNRDYLTTRLGA